MIVLKDGKQFFLKADKVIAINALNKWLNKDVKPQTKENVYIPKIETMKVKIVKLNDVILRANYEIGQIIDVRQYNTEVYFDVNKDFAFFSTEVEIVK